MLTYCKCADQNVAQFVKCCAIDKLIGALRLVKYANGAIDQMRGTAVQSEAIYSRKN